jgi:hypothetical protein
MFFPQCDSQISNPYETAVEMVDLHVSGCFWMTKGKTRILERMAAGISLEGKTLYKFLHVYGMKFCTNSSILLSVLYYFSERQ